MNKYLLLPFLVLVSALSSAQNFKLDHDELYLQTEDLTKFEYVLYSNIESTITSDQNFYWEKNKVDCPDGWEVSMCVEICYLPHIHNGDEDLFSGERQEYKLSLGNTQGESGICTWETKFVTIGSRDTTYVLSTWVLGSVSSAEELEQFQFSFYPNPVQEVLQVNAEVPVELVIGNTLGQTAIITDIPVGESELNLSELNRGLYTISFNYKGKNLFTRQFVKN